MKRETSAEEITERVKNNDRSFFRWLKSGERRDSLGNTENLLPEQVAFAHLNQCIKTEPGLKVVLELGCGMGAVPTKLLKTDNDSLKYVGMDQDPDCVRYCRKKFLGLPTYQFHQTEYLSPIRLNRTFNHSLITKIVTYLPSYRDLFKHVWDMTTQTLMVLFDDVLYDRTEDYVTIDTTNGRLESSYSAQRFLEFAKELSNHVELFSVNTHDSLNKITGVLVRRDKNDVGIKSVHQFAETGLTFPYVSKGI